MKHLLLTLLVSVATPPYSLARETQPSAVSPTLTKVELLPWSSPESVARLARSKSKSDFFPLSNHFETQANKLFCGVASSVIVLNSLFLNSSSSLPTDGTSIQDSEAQYLPGKDKSKALFNKFTQMNVFNDQSKAKAELLGKPVIIPVINPVFNKDQPVQDYGLQLRQLAKMLESNGAKVQVRVVNSALRPQTIKKEMIRNLKTEGDFVLVNYSRKALGQAGGGHISPVGAYDEASDSFLIMDVNPNTAPWVWVRSQDLVQAMNTFDTVENRGYLLVSGK